MISEYEILKWMWIIEHDDTYHISEMTKDILSYQQTDDVI